MSSAGLQHLPERATDWEEINGKQWSRTSKTKGVCACSGIRVRMLRYTRAHVCVSIFTFVCTLYKHRQIHFFIKKKASSSRTTGLPRRPSTMWVSFWLTLFHDSFPFSTLFPALHQLLLSSSWSLCKLEWGRMCVYLMKLSLKLCQSTSLYLRFRVISYSRNCQHPVA